MREANAAHLWLRRHREANRLRVERIPFAACDSWRFRDGALSHDTGAFFSISGVQARSNLAALDGLALPMVDQPEIGILAFLVHEGEDGAEWLLQAKAEPGTVGAVCRFRNS